MSEVEEDLQTTSEAIVRSSDKLVDLEKRKRRLDADDTERVRLSDEAATLGKYLERATKAESELAREAADA